MDRSEEIKRVILSWIKAYVGPERRQKLIDFLCSTDYFTAPGSTRYHHAYRGGLAVHSFELHQMLLRKYHLETIPSREEQLVAALLHDACKIGFYDIDRFGRIIIIRKGDASHSLKSLEIIKSAGIELTPREEDLIKYHMGPYVTHEFSRFGEYSVKEMIDAFNRDPWLKLFYFADELSSMAGR